MTAVRMGVVGVGHLGYHHARTYAALDNVSLAGVVDTDPARAAKAAEAFGAPQFDTVRDLIAAGVDAASVAVPTTGHHAVALALLEAGVDVLVEKPIADSLDHAAELVGAAAAKRPSADGRIGGRILQVGHVERFNGAVAALFQCVREPRFIECHRLCPYPSRGHDVSVVLDLMIHDLDIALALDGGKVESVDAIGVPVFSMSEDIANARIRFASGCVANLTSSRVSMERLRKIRIFEANAYVSTDYTEQEVLVYRKKPGPIPEGVSPMDCIEVEPLPVGRDEPLKCELAAFATCVQTSQRPLVTGEDGLAALELAHEITTFIRGHT